METGVTGFRELSLTTKFLFTEELRIENNLTEEYLKDRKKKYLTKLLG